MVICQGRIVSERLAHQTSEAKLLHRVLQRKQQVISLTSLSYEFDTK